MEICNVTTGYSRGPQFIGNQTDSTNTVNTDHENDHTQYIVGYIDQNSTLGIFLASDTCQYDSDTFAHIHTKDNGHHNVKTDGSGCT